MVCKTAQLPSHTPFVLIYEKQADLNEEGRCARNGFFIYRSTTLTASTASCYLRQSV
jgi:hypothetical protein